MTDDDAEDVGFAVVETVEEPIEARADEQILELAPAAVEAYSAPETEDPVPEAEMEAVPEPEESAETPTEEGLSVAPPAETLALLSAASTSVDYTVKVGETVEASWSKTSVSGAKGADSWTSDSESVATISADGKTITGVSVGTATITHTYYSKKNQTSTEKKTVEVVSSGDPGEDPEDGEVEVSHGGPAFTVTVKGNQKALSGLTLVAEEIVGDSRVRQALSEDLDAELDALSFLKMYDIHMEDANGVETEPAGNVNLQVTISYATAPEGWPEDGNIYIGHYSADGKRKEVSDGAEETLGVKQAKVKGTSVTFHVKSFSVITAAALSAPDTQYSDTSGDVELLYATKTLHANDIASYATGGDQVQISTVGGYQSVNGTNISKYIEPTRVEDVFRVTVAVERSIQDVDLSQVLEAMPAYIINENKNKVDSAVGTIIEPKEYQNGDCYGSADETKALDKNNYFYAHYSYSYTDNGKTVTADLGRVKIYRAYGKDAGNNHGIVGILPNGKWIVIDTKDFKWKDHGTHDIALSQAQYEALVDAATPKISINGVTDYLDTGRFIYLGNDGSDSKTPANDAPTVTLSNTAASAPDSAGKITWSGNGWTDLAGNTAVTMTYYVRLKTSTLDGAPTDILPMSYNAMTGGTAYDLSANKAKAEVTVQQAVIENNTIKSKSTNCTIEAAEPSVKGMLYYVELEKVDEASPSKKLPGAEFTLRDADGKVVDTLTTGNDGYAISRGLPWGVYTLTEAKPPTGYQSTFNTTEYRLAYLGDGVWDWKADVIAGDKAGYGLTGESAITNKQISVDVQFVKQNAAGDVLERAKFTMRATPATGGSATETTLESGKDGVLTDGTSTEFTLIGENHYRLTETEAPEGYEAVEFSIDLTDDGNGGVTITAWVLSDGARTDIRIEDFVPPDDTHPYYVMYITDPSTQMPVKLLKTDGSGNPLEGAAFTLVKFGEASTPSVLTSHDGGVLFRDQLPYGTYILTETEAPAGYMKLESPIRFQVDPDGIAVESGGHALVSTESSEDGGAVYVLTVTNNPNMVLPETGGPGTTIYATAGITLLLLASIYALLLKRKQRPTT